MGCCRQYFANIPEDDYACIIDASRTVFGAGCLKEAGELVEGAYLQRCVMGNAPREASKSDLGDLFRGAMKYW